MSDFQIDDHGTVISVRPRNEAARQWLEGALCVETRFGRDLIKEIEEAGFEISH